MTDEEVTLLLESVKKSSNSKFEFKIGRFYIDIFSYDIGDVDLFPHQNEPITFHDFVYVYVYESKLKKLVNLETDYRFKDYKPIKYSDFSGYSNGDRMPLSNLYELVKYLVRLNKISAFT